jgi:secreted trypsin-like serine protease
MVFRFPRATFALFFILASILASFGRAVKERRGRRVVVGGEEVAAGMNEYPTFVHTTSDKFRCGGTIVWKDIVLTAAHCGDPPSSFVPGQQIFIGATKFDGSDGTGFSVVSRHKHPTYPRPGSIGLLRNFDNDIMLVKVRRNG